VNSFEVALASSRGIDRLQAAKLASFLQSVAQISLCSHHRATFSFTAAVRRSAQVRGGELQRARSPYLMFAKPTVFIIGAGASAEYGLPLGSALKDRIASAVRYRYKDSGVLQDGDETLLIAIRRQFNSEKATVKSYIAAGLDLAASMPMMKLTPREIQLRQMREAKFAAADETKVRETKLPDETKPPPKTRNTL
jgi:hypothetical protein